MGISAHLKPLLYTSIFNSHEKGQPADRTSSFDQISRLNTHIPDCESLKGHPKSSLISCVSSQLPNRWEMLITLLSRSAKRSVFTNSTSSCSIFLRRNGSIENG